MGRRENSELINRLTVLLTHLLKWQYQSSFQGRSWTLTIEEQRAKITEHLEENPSLKSKLAEAIKKAYHFALIETERQTGLPRRTYPPQCPYTFAQMLDDDFLPE